MVSPLLESQPRVKKWEPGKASKTNMKEPKQKSRNPVLVGIKSQNRIVPFAESSTTPYYLRLGKNRVWRVPSSTPEAKGLPTKSVTVKQIQDRLDAKIWGVL